MQASFNSHISPFRLKKIMCRHQALTSPYYSYQVSNPFVKAFLFFLICEESIHLLFLAYEQAVWNYRFFSLCTFTCTIHTGPW